MPDPQSQKTKNPKPQRRKMVRRKIEPVSFKCTDCGSSITVRNPKGGGQVSCSSCGAVIDLDHKDRKVLRKLATEKSPPSILKLGQKGRFKGKTYEIIGRVLMKQKSGLDSFYWQEYLLFSPSAGYAWLEESQGHWVFLQKTKRKPDFNPTRRGLDFEEEDYFINHVGETYHCWEKGVAQVDYVEGEFPYHLQKGDKYRFMEAISPPLILVAEWTENEIEWMTGSYWKHTSVQKAFGLESIPEPNGIISCQPYESSPEQKFRKKLFAFFALIFFAFSFYAYVGTGYKTHDQRLSNNEFIAANRTPPNSEMVIEDVFFRKGVGKSVFTLTGGVWSYVNMKIQDENNISRVNFSIYAENSRQKAVQYRIPESGRYDIFITGQIGEGNPSSIQIDFYTGLWLARNFLFFGIFITFLFFLEISRQYAFEVK